MKIYYQPALEDLIQSLSDIRAKWRAVIPETVKSFEKSPPLSKEEILDSISPQFDSLFAKPKTILEKMLESLTKQKRRRKVIYKIRKSHLLNSTALFVGDAWRLPAGLYERASFFCLCAMALAALICENFVTARFIIPETQSLVTALLAMLPIVLFPFVEVIALRLAFKENVKAHNRFLVLQSVAAGFAFFGYLSLTLRHGTVSIESVFASQTPPAFAKDSLRVFYQLIASSLMTGVLFDSALALGSRGTIDNPEFNEQDERIENSRTEIDLIDSQMGKIEGALTELESERTATVDHLWRQAVKIRAESNRYFQSIIKITNEPYIVFMACVALLSFGCSKAPNANPSPPSLRIAVVTSPNCYDVSANIAAFVKKSFKFPNSTFYYFDGLSGSIIAEYTIPSLPYPDDNAIASQIAEPLVRLSTWCKATPGVRSARNDGEINIPKVLERVSQICKADRLVLIGSPVHRGTDTNYDFVSLKGFRYPGLGLLRTAQSPFAPAAAGTNQLSGCKVFFAVSPESLNDRYQAKLQAFWSSMFHSRGADLVAFLEPQSCFNSFSSVKWTVLDGLPDSPVYWVSEMIIDGKENVAFEANRMTPTNKNTKLPSVASEAGVIKNGGMSQRRSEAEPPAAPNSPMVAPSFSTTLDKQSSQAATSLRAHMPQRGPGVTIAIRFKGGNSGANADIFLRPRGATSPEISFIHPKTDDGSYFVENDPETGDTIKYIRVPLGIDKERAILWANYSSGPGRFSATVSWLTMEGEGILPISWDAVAGGDSALSREWTRRRSSAWTRISLPNLVDSTLVGASKMRPDDKMVSTPARGGE